MKLFIDIKLLQKHVFAGRCMYQENARMSCQKIHWSSSAARHSSCPTSSWWTLQWVCSRPDERIIDGWLINRASIQMCLWLLFANWKDHMGLKLDPNCEKEGLSLSQFGGLACGPALFTAGYDLDFSSFGHRELWGRHHCKFLGRILGLKFTSLLFVVCYVFW